MNRSSLLDSPAPAAAETTAGEEDHERDEKKQPQQGAHTNSTCDSGNYQDDEQ
jgi:hypothetical protein